MPVLPPTPHSKAKLAPEASTNAASPSPVVPRDEGLLLPSITTELAMDDAASNHASPSATTLAGCTVPVPWACPMGTPSPGPVGPAPLLLPLPPPQLACSAFVTAMTSLDDFEPEAVAAVAAVAPEEVEVGDWPSAGRC